ncbi:MAG: carboxylesterase family protein [Candidatus Thorarchaeota archaeon]|nr:MAG: carboxylesterase family protein [Candidatus Thorarchaeota archaeon]
MTLKMKLALLFSPFIRMANSVKRTVSPRIRRFFEPKPSDHKYEPGTWKNDSAVQTKYGMVDGYSDKGTWCWKGIPYATPPVGELRWKAPLDTVPWLGTRKTRRFGNSAAQIMLFLGPTGSEDCLYLNIWRPKSSEKELPVYLYIHGGGNSIGSSATSSYFGNAVAKESNLLYVSVNYRLGAMGWFIHPAVTGRGSPEDQSGNYGTLDLVKALEWVRDNIRAFGGNPDNVTIAGESGGAFNVLSLLVSQTAKGLFHRAIVESGLAFIWNIQDAIAQSHRLLVALLVKDGKARNEEEATQLIGKMEEDQINTYFRSKSAFTITRNIPTMDFGMAEWRTLFADGAVLPEEGYSVFSAGEWASKVPIIIGCTKDEMKLFGFFRNDPPLNTPEYDLVWRYHSLLWRANGVDEVATRMTTNSDVPVYAYRFDWGSVDDSGLSVLPGNKGRELGAHHAAEIPFFLGMGVADIAMLTGKTHTKQNQLGREKLTELCMTYLANFAKTGNPNEDSLPLWPAWDNTEDNDKVLVLDADFNDLKLSYLKERITVQAVFDLINSELEETQRGKVLAMIDDFIPFRKQIGESA